MVSNGSVLWAGGRLCLPRSHFASWRRSKEGGLAHLHLAPWSEVPREERLTLAGRSALKGEMRMSRSSLTPQGIQREDREKRLAEEWAGRHLPVCFALGSHFLHYSCRGTCSLQPFPSPTFSAGAVCKHTRLATAQLPGNPATLAGLLATRSLGGGLRRIHSVPSKLLPDSERRGSAGRLCQRVKEPPCLCVVLLTPGWRLPRLR